MLRAQKEEFVGKITEKLKGAQSVVLADFKGLSVAQITELRAQLRNEKVEFKVVKNRLGKRALADAGCEPLDDLLRDNTAWAFGVADAVAPAKILSNYAKENEKLVIKGGLLEGRRMDMDTVKQLASLPGRKELLSRMAGDLKQPATKMASVMQAAVTKLAYAFNARASQLGEGG